MLSVLEAIAEDGARSQRQVSGLTGMNLAKVNFVMRRLVARGLVSLRRVSESPRKLRYLYELTPDGMLVRSRLTYRFIKRTLTEYARIEDTVRARLELLRDQGVQRVALVGADAVGEAVLSIAVSIPGLTIAALYDDARLGDTVAGLRVEALAGARAGAFDRLLVMPRADDHTPDRLAELLGLPPAKVEVL